MSGAMLGRRAVLAGSAGLVAGATASARAETRCLADGSSWIPSEALLRELPRLMRIAGVPGVAIAVVDRAKPAWSGSFGVKNMLTRDPVR